MSDYIIRATAANHHIRAFAAKTTNLVETARKNHETTPVVTAALGRLLTAGAMMGSMLKGKKELITLQIKGDGPLKGLIVTADAKANVKGYPYNSYVDIDTKDNGKLDVSGAIGKGTLIIIKDIGMKEPYIGQTTLVSGEIAEDITYYFANSEQVPSAVALGVLVDRDYSVKQSGGFIIQLMPNVEEEAISKLEENLKKITSITRLLEEGKSSEEILELVLDGLEMQILDRMETKFNCNCGKERVEKALISIGKKELESLLEEEKDIELNCHFCNKKYLFSLEDIKKIIEHLNN